MSQDTAGADQSLSNHMHMVVNSFASHRLTSLEGSLTAGQLPSRRDHAVLSETEVATFCNIISESTDISA